MESTTSAISLPEQPERVINNLTMATLATNGVSVSDAPTNGRSLFDLTQETLDAMEQTINFLIVSGKRSKSIENRKLAWEIVRYLRQESKERGAALPAQDLAHTLKALLPKQQVNVQVNVRDDKAERRQLTAKMETGLTAPIRERARNQLAKLDAAAGRHQQQQQIDARPATDQQQQQPLTIEAAEKSNT